ncbi:hypothetical protein MKQ68_08270 [Chitinophaga horti]|uniref:DUF4345 domain-containing protein n=1 Tax=Chitinophaga horti TaxID=2920382 RepID=A0ABY6J5X6_9BACT|nr:hypothetical protein [Chitinophaga horti]UYQ95089.1 hypothetical protein MKQ68_08270 [Chitinophaga horti]
MSKLSITGIIAAIIVIISAFLPWLTIESKGLTFTGLDTKGSSFGEPAILNIALAVFCIVLLLVNKRPAVLAALFCATLLTAWSFRNLLLFSRCEMGECPHREAGLFLSLVGAIAVLVCVLFQKGPAKRA